MYRESIEFENTVYIAKRTEHLKDYLRLFHFRIKINTQNYILDVDEKNHFQKSCAFCKVNSVSNIGGFPV